MSSALIRMEMQETKKQVENMDRKIRESKLNKAKKRQKSMMNQSSR